MPCQDTPFVKAAYTANVSVPKDLQALMSAVLVGEPVIDGGNKVYKFEQKVPIPSYLTAIAVGDIVGKKIGPRSTVWAEKEVVDSAAYEFDATESMVAAGEKLLGKYENEKQIDIPTCLDSLKNGFKELYLVSFVDTFGVFTIFWCFHQAFPMVVWKILA